MGTDEEDGGRRSEETWRSQVEVIRFGAGVKSVRVVVEEGEAPGASADVEKVWGEMARANPRLFNGAILAVTSIDAATGVIVARRETYQRLVVQPRVATGVRQLSVTGVVVKGSIDVAEPTSMARSQVMLGRRGNQTRMYAGLWELGPAGGVEPPGRGVREIDHPGLVEELRREAREEAGIEIVGEGEALGVVYDRLAQSYDVVVEVLAGEASLAGDAWEYQEMRWVTLEELRVWERERGGELIPPTRAMVTELL
jgi:8-oxo-dGTP pyrophosphatase MutT (NUDIX family)